jgi:hypothetical protein
MSATNDLARLMLRMIASDPEALAELADALAPHLRDPTRESDRWMDAKAAADHLGLPSVNALHKLTAARLIPFEQEVRGGKCWFRRSELDAWRHRNRSATQARARVRENHVQLKRRTRL